MSVSEEEAVSKLADAGLVPAPTEPVRERVWETVFDDDGEVVQWEPGMIQEGHFVGLVVIEIPEDKRQPPNFDDSAEKLVFEQEDGERWGTWPTFQLKPTSFREGEFYRITCKGERKTNRGSMFTFKVQRDTNQAF